MALQLKKFSYKALKGMTVQERMAATQDREMGQWLMSLLTPTQFVDLFPDYYRKRLPDISGFMAAMPSSMSRAKQEAIEEQLNNTASGSAAGSNYKAGGWRKKYQENMDRERATVSRRGQTPPPQLSPEQRKIFDDLKNAPIAADDPRSKMFANLSEEQMKQVGISKTKDKDGKEVFQYTAPTVSDEEAKSFIKTNAGGGNLKSMIDEACSKHGVDPRIMYGIVRGESNHGDSYDRNYNSREDSYGPFQMNKASWNPGLGTEFERQTGLSVSDPASLKKQADWIAAKIASKGTDARRWVASQWYGYGSNAGGPKEFDARAAGGDSDWNSSWKRMGTTGDPITADYSASSMAAAKERLTRQREDERIGSLAAMTSAQFPGGGGNTKAVDFMMQVLNKQESSPADREAIKEFLKTGGHGMDPATTSWCAATVGSALRQAGIKDIPADQGGNVATSYLNWGSSVDAKQGVKAGDVVVFSKTTGGQQLSAGETGGHVGMATGNTRVGPNGEIQIETIEGNQSNQGSKVWHTIGDRGMQIRRAREGVELPGVPIASPTQVAQAPTARPMGEAPSSPSIRTPREVPQDNKPQEKKPEAKSEEKKPVEAPKKTEVPTARPMGEAPSQPQVRNLQEVRKNSLGGDNRVNTDQIMGYAQGGSENVLVTNKNNKPLFTMNTNESLTMNPGNDTATVTPKNKNNTIKSNSDNPMQGKLNDMQDSIKELASRFDTNKTIEKPAERAEPFPHEGGAWLNNLNKLTENQFHSPSAKRAFFRSKGHELDNDTGTGHFSYGNRS